MAGGHHSLGARIQHSFYMQTVGSSIRSALGPNMKWLACGGAPLNADLAHFFNGFDGITFIQGYGMTETAAPCLVNFQDANAVGSVGRPGCISIRLADDDELMIKGANVFLGYYKQPQRTAEALTSDGWLHTGDLATIDDRGFVFITGRKKDIIITAGGKNISPAPMEDVINTCPIVAHAVVIGDGRPFIAALIDTLELSAGAKKAVKAYLAAKNSSMMPFGVSAGQSRALDIARRLPRLCGGAEVLEKSRRLAGGSGRAAEIVDYVESVYNAFIESGYADRNIIDMGFVQRIEYNTGHVFKG